MKRPFGVVAVVLALAALAEAGVVIQRLRAPAPDALAAELALEGAPPDVVELDGTTEFYLTSPAPDTDALRLELSSPIAGAKVDVYGAGPHGRVPLLRDRRISGSRVEVRWPPGDYPGIHVSIHHHLRAAPALARQRWYRQAS